MRWSSQLTVTLLLLSPYSSDGNENAKADGKGDGEVKAIGVITSPPTIGATRILA
jgi:hypothetical protein